MRKKDSIDRAMDALGRLNAEELRAVLSVLRFTRPDASAQVVPKVRRPRTARAKSGDLTGSGSRDEKLA